MKTMILSALLAFCISAGAQSTGRPVTIIKRSTPAARAADTLPRKNIDNMPVLTPAVPPPVYRDNTGMGFDRYESPLDRMPILVPDSANKAMLYRDSVLRKPGLPRANRLIAPNRVINIARVY